MNEPMLVLKNITRTYHQGERELRVLNNFNLEIKAGETVALVGQSGSGKSTLLQIAGLLDTPDAGEVMIGGKQYFPPPKGVRGYEELHTLARRASIGFIYQFHHLLSEFSALENVALPQMIAGKKQAVAEAKSRELLASLGLADRASHRPGKLSGGEQQRVAIARALANDPILLLADEPTGNLDPTTAEHVFSMLLTLAKEKNVGALVATHNPSLAARLSRTVNL